MSTYLRLTAINRAATAGRRRHMPRQPVEPMRSPGRPGGGGRARHPVYIPPLAPAPARAGPPHERGSIHRLRALGTSPWSRGLPMALPPFALSAEDFCGGTTMRRRRQFPKGEASGRKTGRRHPACAGVDSCQPGWACAGQRCPARPSPSSKGQRQPSAGATCLRIASMTWALYSTPSWLGTVRSSVSASAIASSALSSSTSTSGSAA